jgi:hypothetical protein
VDERNKFDSQETSGFGACMEFKDGSGLLGSGAGMTCSAGNALVTIGFEVAQAMDRLTDAENDMGRKWWLVGSMLVLGGTALVGDAGPAPEREGVKEAVWLTDYEDARALARQSGKPLLVVFR